MELRTVTAFEATSPSQAGFPAAAQILSLNKRAMRDGKLSNETVHLITSLTPDKASPAELKAMNRAYWKIESALHYRLDDALDEDHSRVRTPKAALVLGMFRRLAVSFALPWLAHVKKKRSRSSTRDFFEHLRAHNARRGFDLITSMDAVAWLT